MALFTGKNTLKPDSRSRIGALQIGEHESPAEDWIVDPTLPVILKNPYGGPGFEDVVVPMGRIVAVQDPIKAYTGKMKNALTIADKGTATKSKVIGVAPYNFCKDGNYNGTTNPNNDRFGGNKPAIITNKYIRLPYIPEDTSSLLCPWGHVVGTGIKAGDYVKCSTAAGNVQAGLFVKWTTGDDPELMVGQILAQDFNQESMGWIKMAMWEEMAKYNDEIWQNYYNIVYGAGGINELGNSTNQPYTANAFNTDFFQKGVVGAGMMDMAKYGYLSPYQQQFYGIPGLTDGQNRALTRFTGLGLRRLAGTGFAEEWAVTGGTLPDQVDGTVVTFQIVDQANGKMIDITNSTDVAKKLVVKVGGVTITEGLANGNYSINYTTGQVAIKMLNADKTKVVTADFCTRFFGTPSYIDFKGVAGVFNVLLKM